MRVRDIPSTADTSSHDVSLGNALILVHPSRVVIDKIYRYSISITKKWNSEGGAKLSEGISKISGAPQQSLLDPSKIISIRV